MLFRSHGANRRHSVSVQASSKAGVESSPPVSRFQELHRARAYWEEGDKKALNLAGRENNTCETYVILKKHATRSLGTRTRKQAHKKTRRRFIYLKR